MQEQVQVVQEQVHGEVKVPAEKVGRALFGPMQGRLMLRSKNSDYAQSNIFSHNLRRDKKNEII